jgi:polyisoprenoid-binding protein YceI
VKRTLVGDPKALTAALALLLVAGLGAREASAETRAFVIDAAASQIRFFATSRFVDAEGRFRRFEGTIRIDETRPETASGTLVVELGSVDTRNGLRDDHLRSSDFFDVDRHPTATFVTTAVQPGDRQWTVLGQLTIRGVSRPITVPVAVSRAGDALHVVGELIVHRRDFGITYQSVLNPIKDEVRVRVELTARPR